jgi:membrane protease YdiL (CAAX protease family)
MISTTTLAGYLNKDRLLSALLIYLCVVYSKRFWLGRLDTFAFWVADVICFVVIPGALAWWIYRKESPFPEFRAKSKYDQPTEYGALIFQTLIILLVLWILHPFYQAIAYKVHTAYPDVLKATLNYDLKVPKIGLLKLLVAVFFGITAGLVEEFFYRGLIAQLLRTYVSPSKWLFLIVSTVVFASAHWAGGIGHVAGVALFGFGIGIAYLCTKDLRPLMAAHGIYDFVYFLSRGS